jgi:hypothetical protein
VIGIEGQYLFKFSLDGQDDFILQQDFLNFTLIEEAGNILPTYSLEFLTDDESIISVLNEGNNITVSFGITQDDLTDTDLTIARATLAPSGNNKKQIKVIGLISPWPYIGNTNKSISALQSAIETMQQIAERDFGGSDYVDFNVSESEDEQYCIQPNITDKKFMTELWMHANMPGSFLMTAITVDGIFRCYDALTLLKKDYDWRFTHTVKDEATDVDYNGDFTVDIQSGLINNWIGYGQTKFIEYLEDPSNDKQASSEVKALLALTETLMQRADMESKFASIGKQNANTHENYWQAYLNNIVNNAVFSSVCTTLNFNNKFIPIRTLDLAMFVEQSINNPQESQEYSSGLYIVSKVARSLSASQFTTTVQLSREALNSIQGSLSDG